MKKYTKYVNGIFLLAAGAVFAIAKHYSNVIIGYFQLSRKIGPNVDLVEYGAALALALGTFLYLRKNLKTSTFTADAVHELVHVSWPSDREARVGTVVVIITVIVAGVVLGVLDMGLTAAIRTMLGA